MGTLSWVTSVRSTAWLTLWAGMWLDEASCPRAEGIAPGFIVRQAPDARTAPRASLATPPMSEELAGLATVTTTSTRPTRTPATRRRGGASSACTTRRGSTASAAASATTVTPCSRTAGVRCAFAVLVHEEGFRFLLHGGLRSSGISFLWDHTLVPCSER